MSISNLKIFPGVIPRTPIKGRGEKGGRKGEGGIRDADGEEGSGMGQGRSGRDEGYTEDRDGKGGRGREGRKEEGDDLAPKQNSWIRHWRVFSRWRY
jgi:hypothetical protein